MDYFKYISNYLGIPLHDIKANSRLLFYTDFPEYLIQEFNYINNPLLNNVVIFIVPNEYFTFKGKHTSEAHYEQKLVLCNNYYIERGNDPSASFIHNLAHILQYHTIGAQLFEKYRGEKVYKDIDTLYPNNKIELYAFSMQLRYLYNKGIASEVFLNNMKQYSDEPCREIFYKRLISHIYKL